MSTSVQKSQLRQVAVLGSSGSIGSQTLQVVSLHADKFQVFLLAANSSWETLFAQCQMYLPQFAVLIQPQAAAKLKKQVQQAGLDTEVLCGEEVLLELVQRDEIDDVMAAIVGAAGLRSTMSALSSGKRVMLANKESMVMAGPLMLATAKRSGATLLPVDSEHNALFQCLPSNQNLSQAQISKLVLTASGGPFRDLPLAALEDITVEQACAHPNWSMGAKISVDSATMMNKALELLEAKWLFGATASQLDAVIHPQSVIHALVSYQDGTLLAHCGEPDMRVAISHSLAWPKRIRSGVEPLDITAVSQLDFQPVDPKRFESIALVKNLLAKPDEVCLALSIIMNAANEVAVAAFLNKSITFKSIVTCVRDCVESFDQTVDYQQLALGSLEDILALDSRGRQLAVERISVTGETYALPASHSI